MLSHRAGRAGVLVDVVAEVHGEIDLFVRQVAERGEVALIPTLARREGEGERRLHAVGRCGAEAAGLAHGVADGKAVEVPAIRLQSVHVHVHAERQFRGRGGASLLHNRLELIVVGDLPVHRRSGAVHAAVRLERARGEPCPEHAAGGGRIAGGDAELEGIVGKAWAAGDTPHVGDDSRERGVAREIGEEDSAVHGDTVRRNDDGGYRTGVTNVPIPEHDATFLPPCSVEWR